MDVILELSKIRAGDHGVYDFIWPVSRREIVAVRDTVLSRLVSTARDFAPSDKGEADLLGILLGIMTNEAMVVFQAYAANRRLTTMGHRLIPPENSRVMSALSAGSVPNPPALLEALRIGLAPQGRRLRRNLSRLRTELAWNGPSRSLLMSVEPTNEVVAIQRLPLIDQHARSVPDYVRYRHPSTWLGPTTNNTSGTLTSEEHRSRIVDTALESIRGGFESGNEELPVELSGYFSDFLIAGMALTKGHVASLSGGSMHLPKRLWTGAGGSIWARILRYATRLAGGEVTGHDHGSGKGHLESPTATVTDFEFCDTFVTFNETQAQALKHGINRDLLIQSDAPEIRPVPARDKLRSNGILINRDKPRSQNPKTRPKIKTVMYPGSMYIGEFLNFGVPLPDNVALDWEARLFSHLRDWGYEFIHKPHPHSLRWPIRGFAESFGGRTLIEPFEEVMHLADVFILIGTQSSILPSIVNSDKGIIFVDYGHLQFTPEAFDMFSRRCHVVKGGLDEANRVFADWGELRDSIENSGNLTDTAFYETYLKLG